MGNGINAKKCKVLEIGCSRMKQRGKYSMGNEWLNKTNVKKDLRIWITDNLLPKKYINKITGDTWVSNIDEEVINKLMTTLVRLNL